MFGIKWNLSDCVISSPLPVSCCCLGLEFICNRSCTVCCRGLTTSMRLQLFLSLLHLFCCLSTPPREFLILKFSWTHLFFCVPVHLAQANYITYVLHLEMFFFRPSSWVPQWTSQFSNQQPIRYKTGSFWQNVISSYTWDDWMWLWKE